jgi:hypothetical protein
MRKITPRAADAIILSRFGRFFTDERSRGDRANSNTRVLTDKDFAAEYVAGKLWQYPILHGTMPESYRDTLEQKANRVRGWHNKLTGKSILAGNRARPTTAYHEALHMYCSPTWKARVSDWLNEAATEWLAVKQARAMGLPPSGSYLKILRVFDRRMSDPLVAPFERAYFLGVAREFAAEIDRHHGPGSFDQLVKELDAARPARRK